MTIKQLLAWARQELEGLQLNKKGWDVAADVEIDLDMGNDWAACYIECRTIVLNYWALRTKSYADVLDTIKHEMAHAVQHERGGAPVHNKEWIGIFRDELGGSGACFTHEWLGDVEQWLTTMVAEIMIHKGVMAI